jgi:hypothetical protein
MLLARPHKLSSRTGDEPSMAPKRKESSPKSACCTSETRVLLHESDQFNLWRSSSDPSDKPRDVANTLDTCKEKDKIDARTNRKGKGPGSCNNEKAFSSKSGRRKRARTHEDPHEDRALDTPIDHGDRPPVRHGSSKPTCVLRGDVLHG